MNKREVIFLLRATVRDDREVFRLFFHHYYARLVRFAVLFDSIVPMLKAVSEIMVRMFRRRKELLLEKLRQQVENRKIVIK